MSILGFIRRHSAIPIVFNHHHRLTGFILVEMTSNIKSEPIDLVSTDDEKPRKRARQKTPETSKKEPKLSSLRASISPPKSRSAQTPVAVKEEEKYESKTIPKIPKGTIIPSSFHLTNIRDLPDRLNVDTVTLDNILCDPMICELWEFNYMHDLDFLMSKLDPDTRDTTKVNVVHGSWKRDSPNRQHIMEAAPRYPNIKIHCAYLPDFYGTHHTKMMVIIRHDGHAQIIIHTANLIAGDWANMTQAAFITPLLPLLTAEQLNNSAVANGSKTSPYGSGTRFKLDFLNYLRGYDKESHILKERRIITRPLVQELQKYDFSAIVGALVGHVPGRHPHLESDSGTLFGWPAIRAILKTISVTQSEKSMVVVQISSIATLGVTDAWLQKTLFSALSTTSSPSNKPRFAIVFPTPDEVRKSLDGYSSGGSIHYKFGQNAAQAKQYSYLRPFFYRWAGDRPDTPENREKVKLAGRKRAAPHIKTFVRYSNPDEPDKTKIDWALVTSANMSKQAWGEPLDKAGEVKVHSYELGVLVAPRMYGEGTVMVPTFKQDAPAEARWEEWGKKTTAGFRMSYDLPLVKYEPEEEPWCATRSHAEPDWMGRSYTYP